MKSFKVSIWGSRGTFVQTSIDKMKYGLETSCISFETETEIFIIDCGSGLRGFSNYFYENNLLHKKVNIFLTHYHHDHILGIIYSNFIYDSRVNVEIYGANDIYNILSVYLGPPYFPVKILERSNIKVTQIEAGDKLQFADVDIDTVLLNHPQHSLGYKFKVNNKVLSVITDYEHNNDENKDIVESFMRDSDCLIIDAFSTKDDYVEGWGHSSIDDVITLVEKLSVGECILYHHNIRYTDDFIDKLQENINKSHSNINFARDNTTIEL